MWLKQLVVNNAAGRMAKSARDAIRLVQAACTTPESVGTEANDQLSEFLVTRICASGGTFVDVGAHIGSITAAVSHHDPTVKIVAIEAMPDKAAALRKRFPGVVVHGCAVGERAGTVAFYVDTQQSGYSSLGRPSSKGSQVTEISVPIARLDDLVGTGAVDVIKIDVEGAELGVLRGAGSTISASRPIVMFESALVTPSALGYTNEAMWDFFADLAYAIVLPNRLAHNHHGLSRDSFSESHIYPRRTTNYFAIPKERSPEIRARARSLLRMSA
jgi:FkbM family methyltransferase